MSSGKKRSQAGFKQWARWKRRRTEMLHSEKSIRLRSGFQLHKNLLREMIKSSYVLKWVPSPYTAYQLSKHFQADRDNIFWEKHNKGWDSCCNYKTQLKFYQVRDLRDMGYSLTEEGFMSKHFKCNKSPGDCLQKNRKKCTWKEKIMEDKWGKYKNIYFEVGYSAHKK